MTLNTAKLTENKTILGTSDSHRVCRKTFYEWVVKHKKKFEIKKKEEKKT